MDFQKSVREFLEIHISKIHRNSCYEDQRSKAENPPVSSITIVLLGLNDADDDGSDEKDFDDGTKYHGQRQEKTKDKDNSSFEVVVGEQYNECAAELDEEQSEAENHHQQVTSIEPILAENDDEEEQDACFEKHDHHKKDGSSFEVDDGDFICAAEEEEDEEQSEPKNHPATKELLVLGVNDEEEEEHSRAGKCNHRRGKDDSSFAVHGQHGPECDAAEADEEEQCEAKNLPSVPSIASTSIELFGLDRVFDDVGNVMRMSSYRLRGLPRKNYKE
jgi:hypothetical protein